MNTIWILLMVASILFSVLNGRLDAFTKAIFQGANSAVGIKRTRYLVPVCILADLVGIIIAIGIVKVFSHFG